MNAEQASKRLTQEPARRVIGMAAADGTVRANEFHPTCRGNGDGKHAKLTSSNSLPNYVGWVAICYPNGEKSPLRFYEKVIKVKADVAALHIVFLRHQRCCVRWRGELSRAPSLGVHLDP